MSPSSATEPFTLEIERIIPGGVGMGSRGGEKVFVPLSAPGDHLLVRPVKQRKGYLTAEIVAIEKEAETRILPRCRHFGLCGGCQFQHLSLKGQRDAKYALWQDALQRTGKGACLKAAYPFKEADILWAYRHRASLKVRFVQGEVLLGFFARNSHRVINLQECPILTEALQSLLKPLRHLLEKLSNRQRLPQVDLIDAEHGMAAVFHILKPFTKDDRIHLKQFAKEQSTPEQKIALWQQSGRKKTLKNLIAGNPLCYYPTPQQRLHFIPGDFTQIHFEQNRWLVETVSAWAGDGHLALDLFCGIGNFSFSLNKFRHVIGIEGYGPAIKRAQENQQRLRLDHRSFHKEDLQQKERLNFWLTQKNIDVVVLDPPRSGALGVVKQLIKTTIPRIIYISCDPATFARDAAILCHGDYVCQKVVPLDMFPQTHHVETVGQFVKKMS
ncbi:23S rRNA (uracil(1939)-C(5))-methyltransferase RlmD [Magnetococcales bacterium HHB-1]